MRRALLLLALAAASTAATPRTALAQSTIAARTRGEKSAPVTVYEMSDFQCPFCQRFALQTFSALEQRYIRTGKVRWVFVNLPLTTLHQNAAAAAVFGVCAARQAKFWPVHDLLFRNQDNWNTLKQPGAYFQSLADSAGLDRGELAACMKDSTAQEEVKGDADGAVRSGARSTPSFYIEGGLLVGAQPATAWFPILDSIVAAKEGKSAPK